MQIGAHALGMYKLLELRARTGVHSAHTLSLTRHFFALMVSQPSYWSLSTLNDVGVASGEQ